MVVSRRQVLSGELRVTLGRRVRELRVRHQQSQEAVAWAADVTQGSISNYEAGRNEIPLSVLISICEYFHTPLSEIFPKATGLSEMTGSRDTELCFDDNERERGEPGDDPAGSEAVPAV